MNRRIPDADRIIEEFLDDPPTFGCNYCITASACGAHEGFDCDCGCHSWNRKEKE